MNQDWQIDLEILAHVRSLDALRSEMHLALCNGPRTAFYEAWTKIHELSREVGWRLNKLEYQKRNPPPVPVLREAEPQEVE